MSGDAESRNMKKAVIFDFGHTIRDELQYKGIEFSSAPVVLMPHVQEILPKIRLKMGIWANSKADGSDIKKWLKRASIDKYFDWIITSSEVGFRKPHREFFRIALDRCGLIRTEVLFVGNQLNTDIQGANEYGIDSIFLAGESYHSPDDDEALRGKVQPTYTIETLQELPNLMDKIISRD